MMEQSLRSLQVQKLTPQAMHSLQLLAMPLLSLEAYLSQAVLDNPYLELRYDAMEAPCGLPGTASHPLALEDAWARADGPSLYEHLRAQARLCPFSPREADLAEVLIANIGPTGYLEADLDAAAAAAGCPPDRAEAVLAAIQSFDPKGVGARSLGECLLLQVGPEAPDREVLVRLLREDLDALAARRFTELGRKYRLPRSRVQAMLDYIQTLDPKPGGSFGGGGFTPYILPDAAVDLSGPRPQVRVGGGAASLLTFDPDYMEAGDDPEAASYLRRKRAEALGLMDSLDLRRRALEQLVTYLVWEQRAFFSHGPAALRPMSQKEAAEALGLSPSTVSRCVRGKYLSTPRGTYPLAYFFSGRQNGAETPAAAAQDAIRALIGAEDPAAPLSDGELAQALALRGVPISRRTVAKYRAQLGLGGQNARKRYA